MLAAWSGSLATLKQLRSTSTLVSVISDLFRRVYGEPTDSERNSWSQSLPRLLDALGDSDFDSLQVILELQMPIGAERADVVLLGGTQSKRKACVLELKQWSQATPVEETGEVFVPGYGEHQYPSTQVLNYCGKLHLFHSRAADYDISSLVYLHNMDAEDVAELSRHSIDEVSDSARLYGKGTREAERLSDAVRKQLLPCALDPDEHLAFRDAPYEQTRHLTDVILRHANDIANRATRALAEAGMGLTEEQERIVEDILVAAQAKRNKTFIVQGGPGSGKTLLAVTLLLRAQRLGLRCVLAIRNNRLQAILKTCFDKSYRGASGLLMYFEVPQSQTGIGDAGFQGSFDLVICDEAQRMRSPSMPTVLARAPVSAIFLDETQRLNPPEEGTVAAFSAAASRVGRTPTTAVLSAAVRCRGGQPYHDWVERLLSGPSLPELPNDGWRSLYRFEFVASINELLERLRTLRDSSRDTKVAMVASWTESKGSTSSVMAPENVRVGYPLQSGWDFYRPWHVTLRWLMRPAEYVAFWMNGKSNELAQVASIYGAQGFESDYVGVIWGRDMVLDGSKGWTLGDARVSYDKTDNLVMQAGGTKRWSHGALDLLKNRYRIFLTRGIKGTVVFCEDEATRRQLLGL